MKPFYVYIIRFCVLLIWIGIDSCHPSTQDSINPDANRANKYKGFLVNNTSNPTNDLGLIISDTLKRESAFVFGKRNKNGEVINVTHILYYLSEKDIVFDIKLSSDFLINEIDIITQTANKIFKYENYDFNNNKVKFSVLDASTNAIDVNSQQVSLDNDIIAKIEAIQLSARTVSQGGRPIATNDCNKLINLSRTILSVAGCVLSYPSTLSLWEIALDAAPATFGLSVAVAGIASASTLLSCISAAKAGNALVAGECQENVSISENAYSCVLGLAANVLGIVAKIPSQKVNALAGCLASALDSVYGKLQNLLPDGQTISLSSIGGAFGDPHLQTFDGLYYDFQGYGEFIALKSLTDNFEIQVRQEQIAPYLNRQVTMHTGIAINTGNDKVCVYPDRIYINNKGYTIGDGFVALTKGSVSTSNGLLTIVSDNEDIVKISTQSFYLGFIDYKVTLNNNRKGKVQGLLGNFDGKTTNDTQLQTGNTINSSAFAELYPAYADSWRISQDKSLFVYLNGSNTLTYTKKDFPKSQTELDATARQQAEAICRQQGVTDEPYLSACILDVGLSGSDRYAISALGAQESKLTINNFNINKFTSFEAGDLTPFGNAEISDGLMYLTRNKDFQAAAVYKKYKVDITTGFETTFDFSMTDVGGIRDARNRVGADGIVFVIQDFSSKNVPLASGVGLGYDGLPRSLAIEFDTYNNGSYENQDDISLNTQGINPNSVDDSRTLIKAQTRQLPTMNDGKIHNVLIRYTKKSEGVYKLEVFFDKDTSAYLTTDNINIQQKIGAYGTGVYIGLTSATGYSWENHIIHNWSFRPLQ